MNAENVIETKGRVACEVNTADELVRNNLYLCWFFVLI